MDPGDLNHVALRPGGLPPGYHFDPTPEDIVRYYLDRRVAGEAMADKGGFVVALADVYGAGPDLLRRRHPPGSDRRLDSKWYFLSERGAGARNRRRVATGGFWKLQQRKRELRAGGALIGFTERFRFCLATGEETPWLMDEYTGRDGDGGSGAVPVLCKMYVSPAASDEERRAVFGEDVRGAGQAGHQQGAVQAAAQAPVRVMVPTSYFDALAALLPPGSVRGAGQGQAQHAVVAPPPLEDEHQDP